MGCGIWEARINMESEAFLLWSVLFSSIGLGFFVYGKRQRSPIPLLTGLALMSYPYFVGTVTLLIGAGIVLIALPYFIRI